MHASDGQELHHRRQGTVYKAPHYIWTQGVKYVITPHGAIDRAPTDIMMGLMANTGLAPT